MSYIVSGLPAAPFRPLFGLTDEALAAKGVVRVTAGADGFYPCRVSLEDARPGETLLLLNYEHQSAPTPYGSRHAIFVGESARETGRFVDEMPAIFTTRRLISLRAFDEAGMMIKDKAVDPGIAQSGILSLKSCAAQSHAQQAHRCARFSDFLACVVHGRIAQRRTAEHAVGLQNALTRHPTHFDRSASVGPNPLICHASMLRQALVRVHPCEYALKGLALKRFDADIILPSGGAGEAA